MWRMDRVGGVRPVGGVAGHRRAQFEVDSGSGESIVMPRWGLLDFGRMPDGLLVVVDYAERCRSNRWCR
jgi:hypothetical protein